MRPLVGITAWKRRLDTYYGPDTLQTLSAYYTDSIVAAEMSPVIFPAALAPSEADRLVTAVDGILLSGGSDVDPAIYGAENTDSFDTHAEVDDFEMAIVEAAKQQRKPLLAICRGLQLLNVALGGTLVQEVSSDAGVHQPVVSDHEEMSARRHVVTFEEGAVLGDIYDSMESKVNTLHHQGVDRLAPGLIVEARAEDGLIEAARYQGDWWALGVQWHPERLGDEHQRLFTAFRAAIIG